jgi:hypothetical protein
MADSPARRKEDAGACAERIKEIGTAATRVALVWFAALVFVWATKIEPSFGPVLRYQNAVKRKKNAEKLYRKKLSALKKKYDTDEYFALVQAPAGGQPGEPSIRWAFVKRDRPRAFSKSEQPQAGTSKEPVTVQPSLGDSADNDEPRPAADSPDEDPPEEEKEPPYWDRDKLKEINAHLRTLTRISLDAEARRAGATTVEFELLSYKFPSSVLYAPLVWNLFFLGLFVYLFFSRRRLIKLIVRYIKSAGGARLYHAPWWVSPLPRLRGGTRADETVGWDGGKKTRVTVVAVLLILAMALQGRVARIGLEVIETLGSGREATLLAVAHYLIFILSVLLALLWLLPTDYKREEGGKA